MPNVVKVQAGYQGQPLSAFLKQPPPPAALAIDFLPATTAGIKENFFPYLDAAPQFVPETADDKAIRARLATTGIGPDKKFDFKDLSAGHNATVLLAMKEGDDKVDKYLATGMKDIEGWRVGSLFGVRSFYNGAVEAMYPMTRDDATGEAIDTGQHNYTLTLTAGQSPPVNAFWSLTMYDSKSQLLIEMPGPNGPAYLVMRLYWPKTEAPSILPAGDGTGRPPGIVKAS